MIITALLISMIRTTKLSHEYSSNIYKHEFTVIASASLS